MKLKILFIISLSIILNNCASHTITEIDNEFFGTYISTDIILQEDYLYVRVDANGILIWFGDNQVVSPLSGDDAIIIGPDYISGVSPNYSFQNVDVTGSLVFFNALLMSGVPVCKSSTPAIQNFSKQTLLLKRTFILFFSSSFTISSFPCQPS